MRPPAPGVIRGTGRGDGGGCLVVHVGLWLES